MKRRIIARSAVTGRIVTPGEAAANPAETVVERVGPPPVVWITGRRVGAGPWEVLGVYTSRDRAVARATQRNDFVAPLALDADTPEPTAEWPGLEWPRIGDQP